MTFSETTKLREIIANEQSKAILDKHIPGASTHPQLDMGLHMSLKEIAWYPESGLSQAKLKALVEDLQRLDG